jgi:para-nitrobenzyl esterase
MMDQHVGTFLAHRLRVALAALGLAAVLSAGPVASAQEARTAGAIPAVVVTDAGRVRGAVGPTSVAFLGISYAEPPVGQLRWRPPQPRARWSGVRDATAFGRHCPQPGPAPDPRASEDCLFLTVYVPRGAVDPAGAPLARIIHA